MKRSAGFTLLEMAITLAVLAILSSLALPSLGLRHERQRLQYAAETLASDIAEARFEAARRGQALHVQALVGTPGCWAVATAPDCGCDQKQACQVRRVALADHPGVRVVEGHALRLDPVGLADGADAATLESPHGERLRVQVTRMGRPHVCVSAGAAAWPRMPAC